MADQKNPDERSTKRAAQLPDHARPQPTGNEVFDDSATGAPPRETDRLYSMGGKPSDEGDAGDAARMREAAAGTFNRLTTAADGLTVQARQVYGSSQAFVRSNPASTLAGALAVGVIIGLLIGRD